MADEISNVGKGALGFLVDVVGSGDRDLLGCESRLYVFGCGILSGNDTDSIFLPWSVSCED